MKIDAKKKGGTIPFSIIAVLILILSSFAIIYVYSTNSLMSRAQQNGSSTINSISGAASSLNILIRNIAENDAVKASRVNPNMPFWEVALLAKSYFEMDMYNLSQNILFYQYSISLTNVSFTVGTVPFFYNAINPLGMNSIMSSPTYLQTSGSVSYIIKNIMTGQQVGYTVDLSMIVPKILPWLMYQQSIATYELSNYGIINRIVESILEEYFYNMPTPSYIPDSVVNKAIMFGVYLDDAMIYRITPNNTLNILIKSQNNISDVNILYLWNEWAQKVGIVLPSKRSGLPLPNIYNFTINLSSFGNDFHFIGNNTNVSNTARSFNVTNNFNFQKENIIQDNRKFSDLYIKNDYRYGAEVIDMFVNNVSVSYNTTSNDTFEGSTYNFTVPINMTFRVFHYINSHVLFDNYSNKIYDSVNKFGYQDSYPNGHEPIIFQNYFADLLNQEGTVALQVENGTGVYANALPETSTIEISLDSIPLGYFKPNMFNNQGIIILPNIPAGKHVISVVIKYNETKMEWGSEFVTIGNKSTIFNGLVASNGTLEPTTGNTQELNVFYNENISTTLYTNKSMNFEFFMMFQGMLLNKVKSSNWLSAMMDGYASVMGYYYPSYLNNLNISNPGQLNMFITWQKEFLRWLVVDGAPLDDNLDSYSIWVGIIGSTSLSYLLLHNLLEVDKTLGTNNLPTFNINNLHPYINITNEYNITNINNKDVVKKGLEIMHTGFEFVGKAFSPQVLTEINNLLGDGEIYNEEPIFDEEGNVIGIRTTTTVTSYEMSDTERLQKVIATSVDSEIPQDDFEAGYEDTQALAADSFDTIGDIAEGATAVLGVISAISAAFEISECFGNLTNIINGVISGHGLPYSLAMKGLQDIVNIDAAIGQIANGVLSVATLVLKVAGQMGGYAVGDLVESLGRISGVIGVVVSVLMLASLIIGVMSQKDVGVFGAIDMLATGQLGKQLQEQFFLDIATIAVSIVLLFIPVVGWILLGILLLIQILLNWNAFVNFIEQIPSMIYNFFMGGDDAISITSSPIENMDKQITYVLNQTLKLSASINSEELSNYIYNGYNDAGLSYAFMNVYLFSTSESISLNSYELSVYESEKASAELNYTYNKESLQWAIINTWHSADDLLNMSTSSMAIWGWKFIPVPPMYIWTVIGYSNSYSPSFLFGKDNIEPYNNSHIGAGYIYTSDYKHKFVGNVFVNTNNTTLQTLLNNEVLFDPNDYKDPLWNQNFQCPTPPQEPFLIPATGDIVRLLTTINESLANDLWLNFSITGGFNHEITMAGLNGWLTSFNYTAQNMSYWLDRVSIANGRLSYLQNYYNNYNITQKWSMIEINVNESVDNESIYVNSSTPFYYYYYNINQKTLNTNMNSAKSMALEINYVKSAGSSPIYLYLSPGTYTVSWLDGSKTKTKVISIEPFQYPSFFGTLQNYEININNINAKIESANFILNDANVIPGEQWSVNLYLNNSTIPILSYNSTSQSTIPSLSFTTSEIKDNDYITIQLNINLTSINKNETGWVHQTTGRGLGLFISLEKYWMFNMDYLVLSSTSSGQWYEISYT